MKKLLCILFSCLAVTVSAAELSSQKLGKAVNNKIKSQPLDRNAKLFILADEDLGKSRGTFFQAYILGFNQDLTQVKLLVHSAKRHVSMLEQWVGEPYGAIKNLSLQLDGLKFEKLHYKPLKGSCLEVTIPVHFASRNLQKAKQIKAIAAEQAPSYLDCVEEEW